MTEQAPFSDVGVALVTLFDQAGEVQYAATGYHARQLVDQGVSAVVVAGTTGEAATLDDSERGELLRAVRNAVDGHAPVLLGTGGSCARQAVRLTGLARAGGADGVLVLSPPSYRDLLPYFGAVVAAAGGMPVLAYHHPKASPPGIPVKLLSALDGVCGVKDSSGDAMRLLAEVESYGGALYVGAESLLLLAGSLGVAGAISGLANIDPAACQRAWSGDVGAQQFLGALAMRVGPHPHAGIKRLLAEQSGLSSATRMP